MIKELQRFMDRKKKGEDWVKEALPLVVQLSQDIKKIEVEKKERSEPLRLMIDEISKEYEPALEQLGEASQALRQYILDEHQGTDSVSQTGVGMLVFPQRLGFEVIDPLKVDRKYLAVDSKKVNEAIKAGLTNIKGIEVLKKRGLEVRIEKGQPES